MTRIKFQSFSSGSSGNCYFLGAFGQNGECECGILIDAGVSPRRIKKELQHEGLDMDSFQAILVTHDHFDHIKSLGSFCKHLVKPVWSTRKIMSALMSHFVTGEYLGNCSNILSDGWNEIVPGRILARYFVVPHDATQTVGYAILVDDYKFVIMTDIGCMTVQAMELAKQANTVVIESNYDPKMLKDGPYPKDLQDRIRGGRGHLSNDECADAIREFAHDGLRNVFLCHLSDHNNTPELAHGRCRPVIDGSILLAPLPRMSASQLFTLNL